MTSAPDYYEILQVSPKADAEIIQAAYRRLAQKWHPDKNPGDPFAYERMKLLNEAYEVLFDARRRREYDARRGKPDTERGPEQPQPSKSNTQHEAEPVSHSTAGDSSTNNDVSWSKVIPDGRAIWITGAVLFLIGHADSPYSALLFTSIIWAVVFGVPAYLCHHAKMRAAGSLFGMLFILAAGIDVAVPVYVGHQLEMMTRDLPGPLPLLPERAKSRNNDIYDWTPADSRYREFLRDQVARNKPWDETLDGLRKLRIEKPDQYRETYVLHLQKQRLEEARQKQAEETESIVAYLFRKAIPVVSALGEVSQVGEYRGILKRFNDGKATKEDIELIARFEYQQGIYQNRGNGGQ